MATQPFNEPSFNPASLLRVEARARKRQDFEKAELAKVRADPAYERYLSNYALTAADVKNPQERLLRKRRKNERIIRARLASSFTSWHPDEFKLADWVTIPLPGTMSPKTAQLPPLPNHDARRYLAIEPQDYHPSPDDHHVQCGASGQLEVIIAQDARIPDINEAGIAAMRTAEDLLDFKDRAELAYKARRSLYLYSNQQLHKSGWCEQSESGSLVDDRQTCARCYSSLFDEAGHQLRCHDCGFPFVRRPARKIGKGRARRLLTQDDFIRCLLFYEKRSKSFFDRNTEHHITGNYLILVEGWLSRDVRSFFSEDSEAALDKRADRFTKSADNMNKMIDVPEPPSGQELTGFFIRLCLAGRGPLPYSPTCPSKRVSVKECWNSEEVSIVFRDAQNRNFGKIQTRRQWDEAENNFERFQGIK